MFERERLTAMMNDGWVLVDKHGTAVGWDVPQEAGPAFLVVEPMTDALKRVDENGVIVDSVDRDAVLRVVAIGLHEHVVRGLPDGEISIGGLMEAVRQAGYVWSISSTSGP